MPRTYEPIATQTVGTAVATVSFTSIPQTYTDLVLIINGANTTGNQDATIQFNSDTAANYSNTTLRGNGTTASGARSSSATFIYLDSQSGLTTTSGGYTNICNIMNYANTTTYKTLIARGNNAATGVDLIAGLWRSTSAITQFIVTCTTSTFVSGSTFTLYGIKAA
jgi:hypothetical protein